ncbi:MAG: UvrD-helicase domain-containing protein, partial [Acidimicrobiia bacterium]|nr:UvrD-helicase domain-containing protein [Acidimicrobiia bacterium]
MDRERSAGLHVAGASAGDQGDELAVERAALAHIAKTHHAHLDHTRRVAAGLAAEAAEAIEDGIRDIVDEDAEADAAVQAVLIRQMSDRAMYAARRVADLEAQGEALAFGKMVSEDSSSIYVGRRTVFDGDEPLLIDWRARAAIPFYRATPLQTMGYRQRRHLHYDDDPLDPELIDYSDEVFDVEQLSALTDGDDRRRGTGLRGEAALLANLVAPTREQMRSVVATIQAEQDAVVRSPANRMLIVQGGPGTGKTVVALHRAAYLLYDQRVDLADTGVLIVGPSNQFLRYISGVLPSLGESGVVSVTVPRLYRGVRLGGDEPEEVGVIKRGPDMVALLAAAVGQRQRRPKDRFVTWYGSRRVVIPAGEIQLLFDRAARQALHNDGAALFRRDVIDNLIYQVYDPAFHNLDDARVSFEESEQVTEFLLRHFPPLSPEQALNDLLGSEALLRAAASAAGLDSIPILSLQRPRCPERDLARRVWSDADAPLLDELLALLGPVIADGQRLTVEQLDEDESWIVRDEADEFELAQSDEDNQLPSIEPFERPWSPDDVEGPSPWIDPYFDDPRVEADELIRDASSEVSVRPLVDEEAERPVERERSSIETALAAEGRPAPEYDGSPVEALDLEGVDAAQEEGATVVELVGQERSWQFGHVIVDEAQDLTPMQWRMVARRSSGGGLTVVGDLAQRIGPPARTW